MHEATCSIDGCEKPRHSHAMCGMHAGRVARNGSPHLLSHEEKFWSKVDRSGGPDSCWLWTAGVTEAGYGQWRRIGSPDPLAHRAAYVLAFGAIPEGLQLDHLCRNRACVNPDHLEPVTCRVNNLRGTGPAAVNARKTHCINGHEFTSENTYRPNHGTRKCKTCARERARAYKARRKAMGNVA